MHLTTAEFSHQDQDSSLLLGTGLHLTRNKCTNISIALLLSPINCHTRVPAKIGLHTREGQTNLWVEQKARDFTQRTVASELPGYAHEEIWI